MQSICNTGITYLKDINQERASFDEHDLETLCHMAKI